MNQLEVVLVGPQDFFFDPVAEAVAAKGHRAVRYTSPAAFLAKEDAIDDASVLYAVGNAPISHALMARAKRLRAVISPWTGTDGFDEAAATALGILVGNGQVPENVDSMAEATVLMILACLYDLNGTQRRFRTNGTWANAQLTASMLKGKTIGILGFGGIARGIVARLSSWGVDFCAATRNPPADPSLPVRFLPLEDMLAQSDIVCVLTPLTDETRGLLDARRLKLTKRGSILVCTSRGGIIDEAALADLARGGHFAAVGLDVFAIEPLPMESPLRTLSNAVLTPHGIGHTREMRERLVVTAITGVLNVLAGEPPPYVRNPAVLAGWRARFA